MPSTPDQLPKWTPLPSAWREAAFTQPGTVLLESSLPGRNQHHSYLFTGAKQILTATSPGDLPELFEQIEQALQDGQWVAGSVDYEAGTHFVGLPSRAVEAPLAAFGVFDAPRIFDHAQNTRIDAGTHAPAPLPIAPMLRIRREQYIAAVGRIQQWIAAGETYQLNFTTHATSPYNGDAAALYDALQAQQPCSYGSVLRLRPEQMVLSLSPELFFRATRDGSLTTKPMKGTSKSGATEEEDNALAEGLRNDEKNRAEHVMIVDLLRNDLGRICEAGSVRVDRLFDVERYPTLLQMTSTITGRMPPQTTWYRVFQALFPSGSITGAPKRHTMELIGQIEEKPRGVYTGAIGYFAPDRSACFSVAIRTVVLERDTLELGVGGGVVADSTAEGEYDECLLKTAFLHRTAQPIGLIETMRAKDSRILLLGRHLARLQSSALALGVPWKPQKIEETIQLALQQHPHPQRVRLVLKKSGACVLTMADLPAWHGDLNVRIATRTLRSDAPHLRHKTSFRPEYGPEFKEAATGGFDEAIFCNERGEVADGCISTILVCMEDHWYTPPLSTSCLPGVYRGALLQAGLIRERSLTLDDLRTADHLCICNAVRGTGSVASLQLPGGERSRYKVAAEPPQLSAW